MKDGNAFMGLAVFEFVFTENLFEDGSVLSFGFRGDTEFSLPGAGGITDVLSDGVFPRSVVRVDAPVQLPPIQP